MLETSNDLTQRRTFVTYVFLLIKCVKGNNKTRDIILVCKGKKMQKLVKYFEHEFRRVSGQFFWMENYFVVSKLSLNVFQ